VLRPPGSPLARALAIFRCTEERGALWSDGHVAVHALVARDLRKHYELSGPVTVIENALDPDSIERYSAVPERRTTSGFTALWVGQADHRKGLDVALRAVSLARRHVPELRLIVAGVPARSGPDGVDWLGVVPPDEIVRAYRRADVLLFPTRYEAHPLVVLEAMAAKLPVIVSDAVPPGMVTDERNGFVIVGHQPEDHAVALLRLHGGEARRPGRVRPDQAPWPPPSGAPGAGDAALRTPRGSGATTMRTYSASTRGPRRPSMRTSRSDWSKAVNDLQPRRGSVPD
jgi:glycosyltransferase involved in cell wall biosynthesis